MISVKWCEPTRQNYPVYGQENYKSVHEIIAEVCAEYKVSRLDMISDRRSRSIAWPRQEAMYRTYKETPLSLPAIGTVFGNRDHTTVLHAIRQVEKRRKSICVRE
jgi:chromosomal replication initiator protein